MLLMDFELPLVGRKSMCFSLWKGKWVRADFYACMQAKEVIQYNPSLQHATDYTLGPLLARLRPITRQPNGRGERSLRNAWDTDVRLDELQNIIAAAAEAEVRLVELRQQNQNVPGNRKYDAADNAAVLSLAIVTSLPVEDLSVNLEATEVL